MSNTSITFVHPPLAVPHHVCQLELAYILELRSQREAIDERIQEAENSLRGALEVGAVVEEGIFQASLSSNELDRAATLVISA